MTAIRIPALAVLILAAGTLPGTGQDAIDDVISLLLAEMTVEEKAGQMTQLTLGAVSRERPGTGHQLDPERLRRAIVEHHVGSIFNAQGSALPASTWRQLVTRMQDLAIKESLHRIPLLYGIDAAHGAGYIREATLYPHNLGLAATRNPSLVEQCHGITGREVRAVGIPWVFAPMLDVGRQPLWSRFAETFGEDVHLTRVLGVAAVRGLQGRDLSSPHHVAATGKHFLGSGFPFNGMDRSQSLLPERYLREYFLPPFQDAVEQSGLRVLIVNPGEINGIPVHANYNILTKLLRGQMGFKGVVVSDWDAVRRLHHHHRIAPTHKEAVRLAIESGIDLCMSPYDFKFTESLIELVHEGSLPEQLLDDSCRRILRLKHDLGLFEDPYPKEGALSQLHTGEARQASLEAARESLVLLANDGTLPLAKGARILLTGPGCESRGALHGPWSYTWQGRDESSYPATLPTVADAFEAALGKEHVTHVAGLDSPDRALRAAHAADVIVCVLAERPSTGQPGNRAHLELPPAQRQLVRALAFGKPLVLVLLANRPPLLTGIADLCGAVVWAGYPGPYGGQALQEILTGAVNPSGKLPFTYPRRGKELLPYDHKLSDTGDPSFGSEGFDPLYEFGHGLSYTTFRIDKLTLAHRELTLADHLDLSVELTNTGDRAGAEVVHVFVRDRFASITPPVKRLRAFRKVKLDPGERKTLAFRIPVTDLSFVGARNIPEVEPGEFEVRVGNESATFSVR